MLPAAALLPDDDLSRPARRALTACVLALHAAGFWALLQIEPVRDAVSAVAPIVVDLIAAPKPAAQPQPAPRSAPLKTPPRVIATATPAPAPFAAPPMPMEPLPVVEAAPAPAIEAPAPTPAPQPPKRVPPSALRYTVEPPISMPPASLLRGESGTVVLRVVVDALGHPKQIALLRSSGYPRLDENALAAMKLARFKPCTDNGAPIECESSAALAYELEN